jgi:hypothetical protein
VRNPDDSIAIKDSNPSVAHNRSADTSANQELASIYDEYIGRYKRPCIIDSVFAFGTDTFKMHFKHYCLMDSAITVPKQYVNIYKLDSFVTHNFVTEVKLDKNSKTIFQATVYKKNFEKFLYPQLKEYGILFCPEINLSRDTIELDYSISIPLTDIGVGVEMIINRDGSVVYKAR